MSAFGGGIYGMSGAKGVPLELLEGSIFPDYFIPSFILFFVVGGFSFLSAIMVFKDKRNARRIANLTGIIILAWIVFQMNIIGYVSWMQPFIAVAGISILFLSGNLPDSQQGKSSGKNINAY